MNGCLYVIATPLGNLDDLSPRALQMLGAVDLIACEDTRRTRKLLTHFSVTTPTTSYHEHNELKKTPQLLAQLRQGRQLALVSDAGTPAVSDPGYRLIRACREASIDVYPIPGPSAVAAALSVAGLPCDRFCFEGFLPHRATTQRRHLQRLATGEATLVLYLPPHGLMATLGRIRTTLGNRTACLIREMTKLHETHYWGQLDEILKRLETETPRGEYTLVVEGRPSARVGAGPAERVEVVAYVRGLQQQFDLSEREAIRRAARDLALPRRQVYGLVHQSAGEGP